MHPLLNNLPITRVKLSLARILFYMVKPFYGTKKRIINRNGLFFEVDLTEGLDLSLFLFGNFQKHVSENKFITLSEDAVIIDVGSNVGIMSLNFARKVKNGKVYAFEPTHYAFKKLQKNLSLNPQVAARIQTIQSFVSCEKNKSENIKAFSSWKIDKHIGKHQHPVHGGAAMSTEGVPTTTIDEFVNQHHIDRLDFIKIDTDGHEFDVLLGAKKTITRFRPQIIFELGQYVMNEREINFIDYQELFDQLDYTLSDAANNHAITLKNYNTRIPKKGTIDVLAVPRRLVNA